MKKSNRVGNAVIAVVALTLGSAAQAGPKAEHAQELAQRLSAVESQIAPSDHAALDYYLGGLQSLLDRYQPVTGYICASNGEHGSFERFRVTDPATGAAFGGETTLGNCQRVIGARKSELMCLSNGEHGSFEKFSPQDFGSNRALGGVTGLDTCLTLVARSNSMLICVSNGEHGSFEKFNLYNRKLGKTVGGATRLDQCLSSIPN